MCPLLRINRWNVAIFASNPFLFEKEEHLEAPTRAFSLLHPLPSRWPSYYDWCSQTRFCALTTYVHTRNNKQHISCLKMSQLVPLPLLICGTRVYPFYQFIYPFSAQMICSQSTLHAFPSCEIVGMCSTLESGCHGKWPRSGDCFET